MLIKSNESISLICYVLKTLFKVEPVVFLSVLSLSLLSQSSYLLALLLPLKIIMLLSLSSIPDSFPKLLQKIPYDIIVISLGFISMLFYIFGSVTQKIADRIIAKQNCKLDEKTAKFEVYEDQMQLAKTLYGRLLEFIAELFFLILGIISLSLLYVKVAIFFAIGILLLIWFEQSYLQTQSKENNDKKRISYDFIFLSIFVYILADKLYFDAPEFIVCLIAIVIVRILVSKTFQCTTSLNFLIRSQDKLKVIFLGQKLPDEMIANPFKKTIWDAIKPTNLYPHLQLILKELLGSSNINYKAEWLLRSPLNTQILIIKIDNPKKKLALKIHDSKISKIARHELNLLSSGSDGLPVPELLKNFMIGDSICLLFDITDCTFVTDHEINGALSKITNKLLTLLPSDQLIDRCQLSKYLMWEKLDNLVLDNLSLIANIEQSHLIAEIKPMLPYVRAMLSKLPLCIDNIINEDMLLKNHNGEILLLDWGKWELVPIGGSLKKINHPTENSHKVISLLSRYNDNVQDTQLILSAEVSNLFIAIRQQNYHEIFREHLPRLKQAILNSQLADYSSSK